VNPNGPLGHVTSLIFGMRGFGVVSLFLFGALQVCEKLRGVILMCSIGAPWSFLSGLELEL